jgi:hypothetical protein
MLVTNLSYYVIVTGVGQCAVDAINATGPELARVCLHVPGDIAWDDCQCGSFTQSAGPWLWSENGRAETTLAGDDNLCAPAYLGLQVTAVVLRCVTQLSGGDLAPPCPPLALDSQQWHKDAFALRRGILCCLEALRVAGTIQSYQITSHTAAGPQGMCVGSQLVYRIWLPNCDCI